MSHFQGVCDGCGKPVSWVDGGTSWREGTWTNGQFVPGERSYQTHTTTACQRAAVSKPEQITLEFA